MIIKVYGPAGVRGGEEGEGIIGQDASCNRQRLPGQRSAGRERVTVAAIFGHVSACVCVWQPYVFLSEEPR